MDIELTDKLESYTEGYKQLKEKKFSDNPEWLKNMREGASREFSDIGFPTVKDEDWRFTNLAPISRNKFHIIEDGKDKISSEQIDALAIPNLGASRLVFVNGHFSPELSGVKNLPEGVIVSSLQNALKENEQIVGKYLGKYAKYEKQAFIALNTTLFEDGLFLYVPKSVVVENPVYALFISTDEDVQSIVNQRNLVIAEDNSDVKIIEHYVSTSRNVHFSNVVTEAFAGENCSLEHYMLECESSKAFNISTLRIEQKRNSNIKSHSVLLGGALVRNNVHPVLGGEGSHSLINGLYMSTGRQHMDNFMRVEHASPHCDSRQFYNGVLDKKSKGVFHGRIVVHENAAKTDAKQTNKNLLLTDTAQVDTKPQLEIYNEDVKCTHGATIGQMDEDAIFYLQSRGISEDNARTIMLRAFTDQSISNMGIEPVKEYLKNRVDEWFKSRKK